VKGAALALAIVALAIVALASGAAGGYALGRRSRAAHKPAPVDVPDCAPPALVAAAVDRTPADYQALKNKLAVCMAFQQPADERDQYLLGCRAELDGCNKALVRTRDPLSACYDFTDFAPIYDRELGEVDPSPETLERAKNMTAEECVRVMTWGSRARYQLSLCLSGDAPPGFKERYGNFMANRPLTKACNSDALKRDAMNAWFKREEGRVEEAGGRLRVRYRMGEDGGVTGYPAPGYLAPSGGDTP
jgi:hypothetical protein